MPKANPACPARRITATSSTPGGTASITSCRSTQTRSQEFPSRPCGCYQGAERYAAARLPEPLHLPSLAIFAADERRRVGTVRELELFGVPLQPAAGDPIGRRPDEHRLGQRAAVREVVARFAAFQNRVHPLVIMVLRLDVVRVFGSVELLFRHNYRLRRAVLLEDSATLADPVRPRRRKLHALGQHDFA